MITHLPDFRKDVQLQLIVAELWVARHLNFEKDGSDVKAIAKYDGDGKKVWEIHVTDHKGLGAHSHLWKDGKPIKGSESPLADRPDLLAILNIVRNLK